jgi:cytochrome c-type biogenesis protein CcmH/NrfG
VLDNGEGRVPRQRPGPAPTTTATMLPDQDDPRRIGELLGDWLAIRMEEVDALVDEAESKVAVLPDQRHLWLLLGETLVRLHCLELEVAELRKAVKR